MKKLILIVACALALTLPALAEPMVMGEGYTAWLGESGHMYLQDPEGQQKVLRYPIADLLSIADGSVHVLAQDGRLFAVALDGSQTLVTAERPTDAQIAAVTQTYGWLLEEGSLYAVSTSGLRTLISTGVTAAAQGSDRLFFITQSASGVTSLKSLLLTQLTTNAAYPTLLGMGVENAMSMTVSADSLAVVAQDRSVTVLSLVDFTRQAYPAVSALTERAAAIGTQVLRYAPAQTGWTLEENNTLPTLTLVDPTQPGSYTSGYTSSQSHAPATPTPTPRTTPRPTATPRPTPTPTPEERYPQLSYGDIGSQVRTLQRRLQALGYPVGKVDGTWGKNTQLAVNLFQCALGWKERSYASSAMQERLYARNAPQYDPYAPLREGDEGTDVMLMQKALFDLGYLGTDEVEEVDGRYGPITTKAIIDFQAAVGRKILAPTGYADADTLMVLFSEDAPRNPALAPPTDPNYPEFIVPGTPGNPVVPPTTSTDLIVIVPGDG